jgi:glutamine synthetase adenylyltransferase
VQVVEQRQTQKIPEKAEDLRALARQLGYAWAGAARRKTPTRSWRSRRLDAARPTVRDAFLRFSSCARTRRRRRPRSRSRDDPIAVTLLGLIERGEMDEAAALLEEIGFADGARSAASLSRIYRGRVSGPASPQRRRAVERMAPHCCTPP